MKEDLEAVEFLLNLEEKSFATQQEKIKELRNQLLASQAEQRTLQVEKKEKEQAIVKLQKEIEKNQKKRESDLAKAEQKILQVEKKEKEQAIVKLQKEIEKNQKEIAKLTKKGESNSAKAKQKNTELEDEKDNLLQEKKK